jgi:hypothetical protein
MVDVKLKRAENSVFSFLSRGELEQFVDRAHELNLIATIAGSLNKADVPSVYALGADIIGVRGAVCAGKDRLNGVVQAELVREFVREISECVKG